MRRKGLWLAGTVIGLTLIYQQYLSFTGFCYSEMRRLTPLEIIQAGIHESAREEAQKDITSCCGILYTKKWFSDKPRTFFNRFLFRRRYAIVSHIKNPDQTDTLHPYYAHYVYVNACGKDAYHASERPLTEKGHRLESGIIKGQHQQSVVP